MRRRAGETLLIGPEIQIDILEVSPTRVKFGITAPAEFAIVRKEVAQTRAENLSASRTAPPNTIAWLSRKLVAAKPGLPQAAVKSLTGDEYLTLSRRKKQAGG